MEWVLLSLRVTAGKLSFVSAVLGAQHWPGPPGAECTLGWPGDPARLGERGAGRGRPGRAAAAAAIRGEGRGPGRVHLHSEFKDVRAPALLTAAAQAARAGQGAAALSPGPGPGGRLRGWSCLYVQQPPFNVPAPTQILSALFST